MEFFALSNHNTPGPGNGSINNGSSFSSRREARASNPTGALPVLGSTPASERGYTSGSAEFDYLIQSLHELFEQDRQVASQPDATRCGICYLYFTVSDLYYREEGFYVCQNCEQHLGKYSLPMVRKQQKL